MPSSERLVVVSNRLPVTLRRSPAGGWKAEHSPGGLATAMDPILKQSEGIWIGWSGDTSDPADPSRQEIVGRWAERDRLISVELPAEMANLYYEGYANQVLWPLFHQFPTLMRFSPEAWTAYRQANERFRDAVVANYRPGDLIWVHDYQLMLLPRLLREALPEAVIGFFLHIPWPSSEVFRILPRRDELLDGLLGADLLGFHTHSHLQHFRSSLLRILAVDSRFDRVEIGGRAVRLGVLPIGIAPEEFTGALRKKEARDYRAQIERRYAGRRILLAVDRLDYTKGIPLRLRAFRRLLAIAPELRGRVVLVQVAVPSREHIGSYKGLNRDVSELVGDINGEFGTPEWTPVVYIRRGMPRPNLAALYAAADIGWVAPLRDGMNLVAKEYVASKEGADGALVLSEFAGAAEEMGEAFPVNPYDEERTAEVIRRVLALDPEERRSRMAALNARVLKNNVFAWAERFIAGLREAGREQAGRRAECPRPLPVPEILDRYRSAQKRVLLLDYDGTLAAYAPRPDLAVPSPEILEALGRLAADLRNCIAVISGRGRADLDRWFGGVRGLWLVAEHGAVMRGPDSSWQPLRPGLSPEWKERVRPVLEHFVESTPGSLIEDKESSLAWHYRMAAPEFSEWLANELVATLEGMLADTELRAIRGRRVVEVKPVWANKGEVADRILESCGRPEFRLAIGDDRTDEDMFAKMNGDAWTVRVGGGPSRARFSLRDPAAVRDLLGRFAAPALAA